MPTKWETLILRNITTRDFPDRFATRRRRRGPCAPSWGKRRPTRPRRPPPQHPRGRPPGEAGGQRRPRKRPRRGHLRRKSRTRRTGGDRRRPRRRRCWGDCRAARRTSSRTTTPSRPWWRCSSSLTRSRPRGSAHNSVS